MHIHMKYMQQHDHMASMQLLFLLNDKQDIEMNHTSYLQIPNTYINVYKLI